MADYSAEYLRRWASPDAQDYLTRLLPGAAKRREVCRFLGASIRCADQADSSRWGATRLADAIRLNVGPAEAALVTSDYLLVMLKRASIRSSGLAKRVADLPQSGPAAYPSVSGSVYVTVAYESVTYLRDILQALWASHEQHVLGAVTRGLNGATRKGHDPLLVEQLAAEAGRPLPQPSYVSVERPKSVGAGGERGGKDRFLEGAPSEIVQTARERNAEARRTCLRHYGTRCTVCGVDFEEAYGPIARGCIHVHHLAELAGGRRATDPIRDLRPVCPNCHLVIHLRSPAMSIEAVQELLKNRRDV